MTIGVEPTIDAMRASARALQSVTVSPLEACAALQASQNAEVARQALMLAEIDSLRLHEADGFSSVATFGRVRLGHAARHTRTLVRVGQMLEVLAHVREAAVAGRLTLDHLTSFDYALRIVGRDSTVEAEQALLTVALEASAEDFHAMLRRMREATLDQLDEAWRRGMDKSDLTLARTLEGWQIAGFLPTHVGAKLKTVLDSVSVPREAADTRAPSKRRIEGLETMCDAILESGLPSNNGIKPQLRVVVDVDDDHVAAKLEAFGPIGPALVAHLACDADWLTIKTRNKKVLDVGRRRRYATAKQTEAIIHTQNGICAAPGCHHQIRHIHHIEPWSTGGTTDLDKLLGYCTKCHILEHQGRLKHRTQLSRAG